MKYLIALGLFAAVSASAQTAQVVDLSSSPDKRIAALEQMLVHKGKTQLEMQQHIDSLQQELNELRGINETHEHRLNQVLQRQRELYQELDKLLTKINALSNPTLNTPVVDDALSTSSLTETGAYQQALNLALKLKKFDQAIIKFKQYKQDFPESNWIPNVHYWLGQLFMTQGQPQNAKVEFVALVENYPESAKRGDALVKLAKLAHDNSEIDKAKVLYQQVLTQYPNTSAAQIAKTRLARLR